MRRHAVIAAGREGEFLNWLPLDLLELDSGGRAAPIWSRRSRDGGCGGSASWHGWTFARSAAGSGRARSSWCDSRAANAARR